MEIHAPPGTHSVAHELASEPASTDEYVATCSGVSYGFARGDWAAFGRDDDTCHVPVWECLLTDNLSRLAGLLWCVDGDFWVRNVSNTHELVVEGGSGPTVLTPRRGERRGAACTVPTLGGRITAPSTGDWAIIVTPGPASMRQTHSAVAFQTQTVTLPQPPVDLLPTAVAMCLPLLNTRDRVATYHEIAAATRARPRTARDRVERLLAFYREQGAERNLSTFVRDCRPNGGTGKLGIK